MVSDPAAVTVIVLAPEHDPLSSRTRSRTPVGNEAALGRVTVRDIVVDERAGIVIMRLSWNASGPGSDKLTAWEMFKVYDGQIHMVQAYIRVFPPALDLGGWPIRAGITQP